MSSLQKALMRDKLPPLSHGSASAAGGMKRMPGRRRDYNPVPWSQYFDSKKDVQIDGNTFRVYVKESQVTEDEGPISSEPLPVLVLLHGGGFSALTWALFAECVTSQVQCYVMAIDLRGHGDTHTTDDLDLSANTLSSDVIAVIDAVLSEKDSIESHPLILIGHSMGGAIAVHAATKIVTSDYKESGGVGFGDSDDVMPKDLHDEKPEDSSEEVKEVASPGGMEEDNLEYKYDGAYDSSDQDCETRKNFNLCGVAVIDVVEGTAMDALAGMQSLLRSRPQKFPSLPNAIEWCVRSGQVRNVESARVSMPGQIKNAKSGETATNDVDSLQNKSFDDISCDSHSDSDPTPGSRLAETQRDDAIREEEEVEGHDLKNQESFKKPLPCTQPPTKCGYEWRIDLARTEVFWPGWFQGLSAAFLVLPVPKLLLLAGIDRLDKALTVGQMQGKFQMQVLPKCGHAVHEDVPDKVADVLSTFLVRHKFAAPLANFNRSVVMAPTPNWSELVTH